MPIERQPEVRSKRSRWLFVIGAVLVGLTLLSIAAGLLLAPVAKREVVEYLRERFQSEIEIGNLSLSFFPSLRASGEAIVFRHHGRRDVPPLIQLRRFEARAGWLNVLTKPRRVRQLTLEGLEIRVSKNRGQKDKESDGQANTERKDTFIVDEIVADGTSLQILPDDPDKDPLTFDIYRLTLNAVARHRPMRYRAQLRNAKPPGLIQATGDFGPWAGEEPGLTPLTGDYRFENADLGVFKGIGGTLSSVGKFGGTLNRIEASGTTDTPDFVVRVSGHPVHLRTTYSATVDGTNGNTYLHPVTARFLNSTVVASGSVESKAKGQGKTVTLNATVNAGRVEDMLRLAAKSEEPVMKGRIAFTTRLAIPPGDVDVVEKIYLNGQFGIAGARFSDPQTEQKLSGLSNRAQGEPDASDSGPVPSQLNGRFVVKGGVARLSGLTFQVPGARIHLNGSYGLKSEQLDFEGTARLDAKLSEMTTGWKSFFLKLIDPLFKRKDAGAAIPIRIKGTRDKPEFGFDATP